MSKPQTTLLAITRWVIILSMGFAAVAGSVLILGGIGLAIFGPDAALILARENPGVDVAAVSPLITALFCLIVPLVGIAFFSLKKLLSIIGSVREGDPFTQTNAARLRAMGWLMVALQVGSIPVGAIVAKLSTHFEQRHVDFDMSLNGILAILLVFVLAGVFEQGATLREELEGTV
jgi:hypothetical protein